jgi:formylmethanofuran dehydrogenase subunit A
LLTRIKGGRVIDPAMGRDEVGDVWLSGRHIVPPPDRVDAHSTFDAAGSIVMAGAIDVHSHIAGGNVALARLLLPDLGIPEVAQGASPAKAGWTARETGRLYAQMGYTTVVEPALPPSSALTTHLELEDIPIIDRAALAVLGNDDQLLGLLRDGDGKDAVRDHVALTLATARGLGVKVVNAGGAAAFKENVRRFDLDDVVPGYGLTSRQILLALLDGAESVGVPHPLHVHCNNLGLADAADTLAATARAAEGRPIHFAHAQFYAYASHSGGGFGSAAARICAALEENPAATLDVGQVVFGQTCTVSLDILRQYSGTAAARPHKWVLIDGNAEGGGIVPYHYRRTNAVNALQFAIGLELFLRARDPWRVLLSTDHPNGGPFTAYPRIIHLLMDKEERDRALAELPSIARERTDIAAIEREMSLAEIATMTRAAPARLLGLSDRGHLAPGGRADIAIYRDEPDRTAMFSTAQAVFKDGLQVVEDGRILSWPRGRTITLSPAYDTAARRSADRYLEDRYGVSLGAFEVTARSLGSREIFEVVPCLS